MIRAILRDLSIRRKLVLIAMLTSGIALVISIAAFVAGDIQEFKTGERQKMTALAEMIARNTTAAVMFSDEKSAEETLAGLSTNPHVISAHVVLSSGEVLAEYRGPHRIGADGGPAEMTPADIIRESRTAKTPAAREGDDALKTVVPIILDDQEIGLVAIRSDLYALREWMARRLIAVAVAFILSVLIAYFVAMKLQRFISDPILVLADTMKTVSTEKDYSVRVPAESRDEIGQLIKGFNDMLAQIQRRDDDLERFTDRLKDSNEELRAFMYSAAHDLRQPLVNIRGFTTELTRSMGEVQTMVADLADRCSAGERERLARFFAENIMESETYIRASVDRMSSLINALLKLSQAGHRMLKPERISMSDLTQSILAGLAQQIRNRNATVVVGDLPELTADRMAMEQIMGNLLDNAVKYLVPGRPGRIELSGQRVGENVVYHVRDNGCGISADDMPRLFHLFRRLGKQEVPGDGVGLAFAKTLVKRHGGRIWCESEADAGSLFSFAIPVNASPENDRA